MGLVIRTSSDDNVPPRWPATRRTAFQLPFKRPDDGGGGGGGLAPFLPSSCLPSTVRGGGAEAARGPATVLRAASGRSDGEFPSDVAAAAATRLVARRGGGAGGGGGGGLATSPVRSREGGGRH